MEEAGQMRPPDAEASGRRLRRSPPPRPDGGADRLSALPDDMLLLVLARLRCARSAARTGVLSRRWRGLWTRLPDLTFRDVAPAQIEAALAGLAASPWVSNALDIEISPSHCGDDARLSSLLHAAARTSPRELLFSYQYDGYMEADLPCFQRATFIEISSCNDIRLTRLPAGEFSALEMLSLDACSVTDLGTLVALCPRLRELRVIASMSDILVHSPSLQTLHVCTGMVCSSIDIVTPMLRHLEVLIEADTDLSASISAPMVEKLDWDCSFTDLAFVFGFWRLETMAFRPTHNHTEEADTCWQLRPVHVLHLQLSVLFLPNLLNLHTKTSNRFMQLSVLFLPNLLNLHTKTSNRFMHGILSNLKGQLDDELDLAQEVEVAQEMEKLPVTDFSVLKLTLETAGHVFGALVLRLFGLHQICAVTKRLIVVIPFSHQGRQACPENCPCDEPKNWRCQSISLTRLEEVQIHGFTGEDHEQDLLKLVFRSSPMLNRVTLKLVPGFGGCIQEIYDIFLANPSVKVCVYASNGGLVQRPSMFLS